MIKQLILITFITLFLCGCNEESELNNLKTKVDSLATVVTHQEYRLDTYRLDIINLQEYNRATLRIDNNGYSLIKTDIGILPIKLINIKKYGNGSKIILEITNTTSVTIDRIGVSVTVNSTFYDKKHVDLDCIIQPGTSTTTSFIHKTPMEDINFIVVSDMYHHGIRYKNNK